MMMSDELVIDDRRNAIRNASGPTSTDSLQSSQVDWRFDMSPYYVCSRLL